MRGMQIHQLSVVYLAEQDRILVRLKTASAEEMRLWLTRRLMMGLWPLLTKLLTSHLLKLEAAGRSLDAADESLRKMLADFRKEEFLREADFDTPYQAADVQLPLGKKPLLVTDVDATPMEDGRLRLSFNERLPQQETPRSMHVDLQPKLMQGLMHLLEQALARAQWAEPFGSPVPTEGHSLLEDHQAVRRPRYLN
jgi:hypothetical protein